MARRVRKARNYADSFDSKSVEKNLCLSILSTSAACLFFIFDEAFPKWGGGDARSYNIFASLSFVIHCTSTLFVCNDWNLCIE